MPEPYKRRIKLEEFLISRLREVREQAGKTQDQIAAAASKVGFGWTRDTVASIEQGKRQLKVIEFILLPTIFQAAEIAGPNGKKFELKELFLPTNTPLEVGVDGLSDNAFTALLPRRILEGRFSEIKMDIVDVSSGKLQVSALPGDEEPARTKALKKKMGETMRLWKSVWPEKEFDFGILAQAEVEARGDAEIKVARKLGVTPLAVAIAAQKLWSMSLTLERDTRILVKPEIIGTPQRMQAKRGHMTRQLVKELEPVLEKVRSSKKARQ